MIDNHVGSVLVTSKSNVKGLFTERDLMRRVVVEKLDPAGVKLKDVMTTELITVQPDDTCSHCLNLMKENRCRHMLVFEDGKLFGILSLRDILVLLIEEKEELVGHLESYISG